MPAKKLLALKIVLCNETKTWVSSPVLSVHVQTRSNPEDYGSDINYDKLGNLSNSVKDITS